MDAASAFANSGEAFISEQEMSMTNRKDAQNSNKYPGVKRHSLTGYGVGEHSLMNKSASNALNENMFGAMN